MSRAILLMAACGWISLGAAIQADAGENSFPTFGVTYGAPARLGAFARDTIAIGKGDRSALLLQAQGGAGGGGLLVGAGRYVGRDRETLLSMSAVVTRTWGNPQGTAPGQTLVGGQVECTLVWVLAAHAGVEYPVGDSRPRSPRLTWGIGVGLPILWTGPLIGQMTE